MVPHSTFLFGSRPCPPDLPDRVGPSEMYSSTARTGRPPPSAAGLTAGVASRAGGAADLSAGDGADRSRAAAGGLAPGEGPDVEVDAEVGAAPAVLLPQILFLVLFTGFLFRRHFEQVFPSP